MLRVDLLRIGHGELIFMASDHNCEYVIIIILMRKCLNVNVQHILISIIYSFDFFLHIFEYYIRIHI